MWLTLPATIRDPEVIVLQSKHVTELVEKVLHHVFLARVPRDVDATHVAINVVRLVTVSELHLVKHALGVHVQWDAGNASNVLVGLVVRIFRAGSFFRGRIAASAPEAKHIVDLVLVGIPLFRFRWRL